MFQVETHKKKKDTQSLENTGTKGFFKKQQINYCLVPILKTVA